jgi:electron transport complex protein RnfB
MAKTNPGGTRLIEVESEVAHQGIRSRMISDYPGVPDAYLEIAQSYANPLLVGPPICDELVTLVQHMFTEEEASLVRHIRSPLGKTAKAMARAVHRPLEEVRPILERLAYVKFVLFALGTGDRKRYGLLPLLPGVFEMAMIRTSLDTLTDWHRGFAELFLKLYETGYFVDYVERPIPGVRYVPVGEAIEAHPLALPSDRLEEILDPYRVFGLGLCQCRMSEQIVGRGCDKPLETCLVFGDMAEYLIHRGKIRPVTKKEALEIKAQAAAAGLASFVTEIEAGKRKAGASCSCCGCCCGGLRLISQFNAPGLIAPPRFVPKLDAAKCTYCGQCATACPVGAMVVDTQGKSHQHLPERCIGCGLCAVACNPQQAIQMEPTPNYRPPPKSVLSAFVQLVPNYILNAWSVWRKHR